MRLSPLLAAAALALAIVAPAAVRADPVAVIPCQITSAVPIYCPSHTLGGGIVYGVFNNSINAQTATVLCYGSTNQNVASGPVVLSIAPLGPTQSINLPGGGKLYTGYLVCQASGAINGTDIDINVY